MRIQNNTASNNFKGYNGGFDTKDKILLSTPALAAISGAYAKRYREPSKMVLEGARRGLKWSGFLLALGATIGINKFLAKNSTKFRDFEENHGIISMCGVGVVATSAYYVFGGAADSFVRKNPNLCEGTVRLVEKLDNNSFLDGVRKIIKSGKRGYKNAIASQPQYVKNTSAFLGKLGKSTMKTLPYIGVGLACAIAVLKPKMMAD